MPIAPRYAEEFDRLRRVSARVGATPALVQAAGGNTSIKADGVLWIKASGTWLMHADVRDLFVPVEIAPLLDAVASGSPKAEAAQEFIVASDNPSGLRPSIETTVHALMPQRIVIHVHCVETIARAIEADAEARLTQPMTGFDWAFVPYRRPGLPLAREIAARTGPSTDVLVLGNHGLVVAGDTVEEAERLLGRVSRALARAPRKAPPADVAGLMEIAGESYRAVADPPAHAVATDPESVAIATGGSYYPDHVIFLGHGVGVVEPGETVADAAARLGSPLWLIVPGKGVLVRSDTGEAAEAMVRCLSDVAARVPEGQTLSRLTLDDVGALLNWDAEKYRQTLERGRPEAVR